MMRPRIVLPFFLICVSTAACTSLLGDFTFGASQSDAGVLFDAGGIDGGGGFGGSGPTTLHAVTSDVSVYLGQRATLDASRSVTSDGALAFAWRLKSAPAGSGLGAASLSGANTATVSFGPDVAGQYVLEVTVASPGASDTQAATVTATVPQVLFAQGIDPPQTAGGSHASAQYTIADLDGGNAHPVVCPHFSGGDWSEADLARLAPYAGRAFDYWEAPAGQPSKFAAFTVDYSADAGFSTHLWAGTSASSCEAPPVDLGATGFGPGQPFGSEPQFSPDGTRFVIFDGQWRIVTYSTVENSAHVVSTYPVPYELASSFLDPAGFATSPAYVIEPPRVAFTASGLAWAQPIMVGWEVVTAPDVPNATPKTYMTCSGVTPREIAMMPDGTVIASYRQTAQSSENLYQLKPDAQQRCTQEHQYTTLSDSGASSATDFAVSPDGTRIAFLERDLGSGDASTWPRGAENLPGGYVNVVAVAGGTPTRVSSDPALYGPRWIGGGTALVFTRLDGVPSSTGRPATSIVVIGADGGGGYVVARGDGVATFVSTSGNAACDCAVVGVRTRWGVWGIGALMTVAVASRRRMRACLRTPPLPS